MTYTAKIEQTKDYKKRMHSMPNTDTLRKRTATACLISGTRLSHPAG